MATEAKVGRSREELLAAAAALTGAASDMDDRFAIERFAASVLVERAKQFEAEAMDAPPLAAAGEVTDERILLAVSFLWPTAVASFLLNSADLPEAVARGIARTSAHKALADPLAREELLDGMRNALAGECSCGKPIGHSHEDGERP